METKELIPIIEEAVGKALNEETLKGLVDKALEPHLRALPSKAVRVGDDPAGEEPAEKLTFSQLLGEVKRISNGQHPKHLKPEGAVLKALYAGSDTSGAYLVPTEESRQIVDLTSELPSVARLCTQVPMRSGQLTFPTLAGGVTAYWIPEATEDKSAVDPSGYTQAGGRVPSSDPTFGQVALNAYVLGVRVVLSNQLLDDSDPGVDAVIRGLFAKAINKAFDVAILRGQGVSVSATDPVKGLANRIVTNRLAAGAEFNFDDLADLIFKVYENAPEVTQVPIVGHTKAEKVIMKLKDSDGNYIYRAPSETGSGLPKVPSVWGEPFIRNGNVQTTLGADNKQTQLFAGDFAGSAYVGQRQGIAVKVIDRSEPYISHNQTAFIALARLGFTVSDEARFALLEGVPTH